jgi:hypothetical protein
MPETSILTIVFRGLLVFHKNAEKNQMEIGILPDEAHILRISTIKNGVLAAVADLRKAPPMDDPSHPIWRLEVDGLTEPNASVYTNGSLGFNRLTHSDERDFRWITDLEGREFYDRVLTSELVSEMLFPVLHIPYGEFYTRLKTPNLRRKKGTGDFGEFGCTAGVSACDISIEKGGAATLVADDGTEVFTFKSEPNTIYEFANSPPDIAVHPETDSATPAAEIPVVEHEHPSKDHFQHYYALFKDPKVERFEFEVPDMDPNPDPALCGATSVGRRPEPVPNP